MDLKTEAKPRILKHEDPRVWSLTDLSILYGHYICRWSYCGIGLDVVLKSSHNLNMSVEDGTSFYRRTEEKSN